MLTQGVELNLRVALLRQTQVINHPACLTNFGQERLNLVKPRQMENPVC